MAVQPVSIGQDCVVDVQVFQDLDDGKRSARKNALLTLGLRVEEANVLVHVENIAVAKTLYILGYIHDLLQVLVLTVVKNRVVYDDAVNFRIDIGGQNCFFESITVHFTERVAKTTVQKIGLH